MRCYKVKNEEKANCRALKEQSSTLHQICHLRFNNNLNNNHGISNNSLRSFMLLQISL